MKSNADVNLKTSIDIARMRRACRVAEECLRSLASLIRPGVTTSELDRHASLYLERHNATPALRGYNGFPGCICTSLNNVAAHGIPTNRALESGDILSIDLTASIEGWFGDVAWSFIVGKGSPDSRRLVRAAWKAMLSGVQKARAGNHIGDIGAAIQKAARRYGCTVIEDYVGHGIGRAMHEDPMVPNFGAADAGMRIIPGMVFTVEPMVNLGGREVHVTEDGWTIVTGDGSLSAQFEQTVAVFRDYTEVLTYSRGDIFESADFPPALP